MFICLFFNSVVCLFIELQESFIYFRFYPFIFNSSMSLYVKFTFCEQHTAGTFLKIQAENLCMLIEVFSSFTFNVIIDTVEFRSVVSLHIFYLSPLFFIPFCSFPAFFGLIQYFLEYHLYI